jgi:hypothetical protein
MTREERPILRQRSPFLQPQRIFESLLATEDNRLIGHGIFRLVSALYLDLRF